MKLVPCVCHFFRAAVPGASLAVLLASSVARAQTPSPDLQKTTVKADRLEMKNDGFEGTYIFTGHVRITGTNIEVTCDRVEIKSLSKDRASKDATVPDAGNIRRMLATGNVKMTQEGRSATCGSAEVLPAEEKIILTVNPVITDENTRVTMKGTRMTVYRGERSAEIENPEVVGPALPNLGFPAPAAPVAPGTPPIKPVP